ncbi:type IV pilin protein [Neisseria animaloris]|uniref:type IV pilin protein n=1 Tax=Neisseria animaloris TaxID=326522 RepID=UPI0039DFD0F0
MKFQQKGFTLTELMIIVLMIGILVTIAYPSYDTYIRRTRLESVRSDLLANVQLLERYYVQNHKFPGSAAEDQVERDKVGSALKQNAYFDISYQPAEDSNSNFSLVAQANPTSNKGETRVMKIDGNGIVTVCSSAENEADCYIY